jgi:hypothetical protein
MPIKSGLLRPIFRGGERPEGFCWALVPTGQQGVWRSYHDRLERDRVRFQPAADHVQINKISAKRPPPSILAATI